jgi:hypothetical protein
MGIAKRSFLQDLLSGFDLLHIDPTKDPHAQAGAALETVIERTVQLIEYIETERRSRSLPEIAYEVGTEETSGGLTDAHVYRGFIERLNAILTSKGLPQPAFIVGQTGTLVRRTENVGRFDAAAAAALARVAENQSTGLKEHNADYLDDSILLQHPMLGITAANVAPEFGVEETAAYLDLGRVEEAALGRGDLKLSSNIADVFAHKTVASERWRKWFTGDVGYTKTDDAWKNRKLRMQIVRVSGHYVFDEPDIVAGLELLRRNMSILGIDMDRYVDYRVERSIDRYVTCFNLENLTAKLL